MNDETKKQCSIVRDLIPLYCEDLTEPETSQFVKEHLDQCEDCTKIYEQTKAPYPALPKGKEEIPREEQLFQSVMKKLKTRNVVSGILAGAICLLLVMVGYSWLSRPQYLNYEQAVVSVQQSGNNMIFYFSSDTAHYSTSYQAANKSNNYTPTVTVQAWNDTLHEMQDPASHTQQTLVIDYTEYPILYFQNADGEMIVRSLPDGSPRKTSVYTLPRISLTGYMIAAAILFVILGIFWLFLRNSKAGFWLKMVLPLPVFWCISTILIRGFQLSTMHLQRDLDFIGISTILMEIIYVCIYWLYGSGKSRGSQAVSQSS